MNLLLQGFRFLSRGNDLGGRQFQTKLSHSTQTPMIIARKARDLFELNYNWSTPVRAICVRAINLVPQGQPEQLDLFTDISYMDRLNKLDLAIEEIRKRFGKRAIFSACLMGDLKMPGDGRCSVVMPGMMYK